MVAGDAFNDAREGSDRDREPRFGGFNQKNSRFSSLKISLASPGSPRHWESLAVFLGLP
jgi:hypothetical protein